MNFFEPNNRVRTLDNTSGDFQHRAWQFVISLEKYSGVWPRQSRVVQCFLQSFHFLVFSITMFAALNGLKSLSGNHFDAYIENFIFSFLLLGFMAKQMSSFILQRRRQKIYEKIVGHYEVMSDPREAAILRESADQGLKFTAGYMCIALLFVAVFDSIPIIRELYHYFLGTGELKLALPLKMDYGVDHKDYWFCILVLFLLFLYSSFVVDVGFDLSFILQIRHVQALFEIVRMRLEKALKLASEGESHDTTVSDDEVNSMVLSAIDLHEVGFQMVKLIEKTNTIAMLMLLSLNSMVFGACIHLIASKLEDPLESFRFALAFLLLIMHFHVIFSHGQKIIDASSSIYDACFQSALLELPIESRKMLAMMMMRSAKICRLTGAQFFPLSIETFGNMFKVGISYYTVFEK